MKHFLYLIILLWFLDLLEVQSADNDDEVSSQLNVDVKKIRPRKWKIVRKKNINDNFDNDNNNYDYNHNGGDNNEDDADVFNLQWRGNGDFGRKNSDDFLRGKLFQNDDKFEFFLQNVKGEENEDEEFPSSPSRRLEPPLKFYSSSIHNLATENIEKFSSTTQSPNATETNSLRIYEIASSNSSFKSNNNKNYGRAFMIDDPSKEINKFDSLRSVISNQESGNYHQTNNKNNKKEKNYSSINSPVVDYNDDKLLNTNGDSEIRADDLLIKRSKNRSFYMNRGNRKYQHAVDNDETRLVRDKTWFDPTDEKYTWKKIQRPINRNNNYRRFGTIARVNFRTLGYGNTENGAVSGAPGLDHPIHHQQTHHRAKNIATRFLCPINAESHVYLADRVSRCQIFYICFGGDIGVPMVCPNGTLFSQELQVCDWWYNVTC